MRLIRLGMMAITLLSGAVMAQPVSPEADKAVRAALATKLPILTIDEVNATPINGLYEVVYGTNLTYVTSDGRFLMRGDIVDLESRELLTENRKRDLKQAKLASLNENEMIIYGDKDLPFQVTVFTDIDCGYCRKLHSQIKEYNEEGIRIRYLAYPRSGIMRDGKMTESAALAESVWCADDKHAALTDAKAGKDVPKKNCNSPVAAQYQLGQDFGVTGTPALLFNDGELVPGYVPPKRLAAALKAQQKK